jgi:hypothetical protein
MSVKCNSEEIRETSTFFEKKIFKEKIYNCKVADIFYYLQIFLLPSTTFTGASICSSVFCAIFDDEDIRGFC